MSITASTFKTRFPEFASVDDARIELFIADSELVLNDAFWGDKYDLGQSYLVAHYLTLANISSSGNYDANNQIASQSVDGTSISFNTAPIDNNSTAYYLSTSYGQRYLNLIRSLGVACFNV